MAVHPLTRRGGRNLDAVLASHMKPSAANVPCLLRAGTLALAARHVAQLNAQLPPLARYRWRVAEPVEYDRFWYFAYCAEHLAPTGLADQLAGAPAYLVWKHSHELVPISWANNPILTEREELWQQAQAQAHKLLAQPPMLALLRAALPTWPLPALPALHRELWALPAAAQAARLARLLNADLLAARQLLLLPGEPG